MVYYAGLDRDLFYGREKMNEFVLNLLRNPPVYVGEGISLRLLEEQIHDERTLQNQQVEELRGLRSRNDELQRALGDEMNRLREVSEHLHREQSRSGLSSSFRAVFAKLPWVQGRVITRNSIEQLLRAQYELSARRLKEAADLGDRLEAARANLFDEIERLNGRIIVSARNEEVAEAYVASVRNAQKELEREHKMLDKSSAEAREMQAQLDLARRLIVEHSGFLKLYSTAEERLDKLKQNTHQLAETIAYLRSDINLYVTAASEKLDIIAGQIQAIGAAADAAVVMLELKLSLETMTDAINQTTQFVSETQAYFRRNVDQMVDELELYDEQTVMVFDQNLAFNEIVDDFRAGVDGFDNLSQTIEELAQVKST